MQIVTITSPHEKKEFIDFIYSIYRSSQFFIDSQIHILKTFLYRKDSFTANCMVQPIAVKDGRSTIAQCILIYHPSLPFLQFGFFDAVPDEINAVKMLLREAVEKANNLGLDNIVIGLNGHVSYGVGIMTRGFENRISFDSLYNKEYYSQYFETMGFERHSLHTFIFKLSDISSRLSSIRRVYRSFDFRTMDKNKFKEDIETLGHLSNICLKDTFLYFKREPHEFFELISPLRLLLRPENLIFALKDGREAGFFLWHPDYNQVLKPGRKNPLWKFILSYFMFNRKIDTVKINAVGVIPEYQGHGVVLGLFMEGLRRAGAQYITGETNFVWDSNVKSRELNIGLHNRVHHEYAVYTFSSKTQII